MANNSETFVAIQPSSQRRCLRPCFYLLFTVLILNTGAMVWLLLCLKVFPQSGSAGNATDQLRQTGRLSIHNFNENLCMTIKGFYKRLSRKVDNDLLAVRDCLESEESAYWRMETPMIWSEAQKTCEMFRQANLVSIHNFEEKQLVYSMALDNTYFDKRTFESGGIWIGLRTLRQDLTDATTYIWADKTPVNYVDWLRTESEAHPVKDTKHGDCAKVLYFVASLVGGLTVGWDNDNCHAQHKFICRIRR